MFKLMEPLAEKTGDEEKIMSSQEENYSLLTDDDICSAPVAP